MRNNKEKMCQQDSSLNAEADAQSVPERKLSRAPDLEFINTRRYYAIQSTCRRTRIGIYRLSRGLVRFDTDLIRTNRVLSAGASAKINARWIAEKDPHPKRRSGGRIMGALVHSICFDIFAEHEEAWREFLADLLTKASSWALDDCFLSFRARRTSRGESSGDQG